MLDRPCSGDLTTIGNNAHVQPALTLVSGDGVRRFSPMFSVFLHGHGFMLLENREPAEVALLQAVHASLSAAVLISSEKLHQPHRSKHLLPLDTLLTSSSSNATDDAARQAVSSLRGLQSLFFVAFHLLLPTPDYDAHGQLDSKTDYLQKVLEVATLYGVMDNLNRPGSTFQNPHWDYPNWDSGWLVIDVPLSDVRPGGGPIEIWPGTRGTEVRSDLCALAANTANQGGGAPAVLKVLPRDPVHRPALAIGAAALVARRHGGPQPLHLAPGNSQLAR